MSPDDPPVAVVTGASRGVGRAVAHELGLIGATVYVTGRSRRGEPTTDGTPGTIDGAAELVTEAGGRGIAVPVDHTRDDQVAALAEQVAEGSGGLDLLVNNVWGGYEHYDPQVWQLPLWEQPIERWDRMLTVGVRAHYVASRALVPLMMDRGTPLIVTISAGDEGKFLGDVQYDVAKAAKERLALGLGRLLHEHGITSVAVQPGFTRTERVEAHASEEELAGTHAPRFVGRAVVALYQDPDVMERTGGTYKVGQLGLDYGFTDVDGSQPEPWSLPEGFS